MAISSEETAAPDGSTPRLYLAIVEQLAALPADYGQLLLPVDGRLLLARRLVVLVPAGLSDETTLAQRVWTLAHPRGLAVLYAGQVVRPQDEPALRRRLALLAAHTRDADGVKADISLAVGEGWLPWLQSFQQPGDLVVCHAEQQIRVGWRLRPLGQILSEALATPIYVLKGLVEPEASETARAARSALYWLGALAVVAACFWLQVNILRISVAWAQSVLLVMSVVVEFGLLAIWNRWLR